MNLVIMAKLKNTLTSKILSFTVVAILCLNSAVYSIDLSNKNHLRPALMSDSEKSKKRLRGAVKGFSKNNSKKLSTSAAEKLLNKIPCNTPQEKIAYCAIGMLWMRHIPNALEKIKKFLNNSDPYVQIEAIKALTPLAPTNEPIRTAIIGLLNNSDPYVQIETIKALTPLAPTNEPIRTAIEQIAPGLLNNPSTSVQIEAIIALLLVSYGSDVSIKDMWEHAIDNPGISEEYHNLLAVLHADSHRKFLSQVNALNWQNKAILKVSKEQQAQPIISEDIILTHGSEEKGRSIVVPDATGRGYTVYKQMRYDETAEDYQIEASLLSKLYEDRIDNVAVIRGSLKGDASSGIHAIGTCIFLRYYVNEIDKQNIFSYPVDWEASSIQTLKQWFSNAVSRLSKLSHMGWGYVGLTEFYHDIADIRKYDLDSQPVGCIDGIFNAMKYSNMRKGGLVMDIHPDHMVDFSKAGLSPCQLAKAIRDQSFQLALIASLAVNNNNFNEDDLTSTLETIGDDIHKSYGLRSLNNWQDKLPLSIAAIAKEALFAIRNPQRLTDLGHDNGPISCPGIAAFAETIAISVVEGLLRQQKSKAGRGAGIQAMVLREAI